MTATGHPVQVVEDKDSLTEAPSSRVLRPQLREEVPVFVLVLGLAAFSLWEALDRDEPTGLWFTAIAVGFGVALALAVLLKRIVVTDSDLQLRRWGRRTRRVDRSVIVAVAGGVGEVRVVTAPGPSLSFAKAGWSRTALQELADVLRVPRREPRWYGLRRS